MSPSSTLPDGTITHLLARWSEGERRAAEELMPLVYDELRRMAKAYFRRERSDHTLQATAVVHEVYISLVENRAIAWRNRSHFYGLAACMMRRALVDYSRERACQKRGGGLERLPFDQVGDVYRARPTDLVALDDALRNLEQLDRRKALIVELRFFGGLTVEETAQCLGLSPRTVASEWRLARAALYRELRPGDAPEAGDAR